MAVDNPILAALDVLDRLHRMADSTNLTTSEAAIFLRSSVSALETMRANGTGPTYSQGGVKGVAGVNQKCLYEKADLLEWLRSNKVVSTMAAAVRKGQLFTTLFDAVQTEAFWIDSSGQVIGMVEQAPITVVLSRLGIVDIAWMPAIDAASRRWTDLSGHRSLADKMSAVLSHARQNIEAAVEATDLSLGLDA